GEVGVRPQAIYRAVPGAVDHVHGRRIRSPLAAHAHRQPTVAQEGSGGSMAVRIRLTRVGAKKQPSYRVVVADSRSARDSRSIETLGHYNPRTEPIQLNIDADKAKAWLAKGALPSDTVARLFRSAGVLPAEKATKGAAK